MKQVKLGTLKDRQKFKVRVRKDAPWYRVERKDRKVIVTSEKSGLTFELSKSKKVYV